jgi:N utilization substance protein A
LAIGKGGQNVRLAAKLTGWRIDIKGDGETPQSEAVADTAVEKSEE